MDYPKTIFNVPDDKVLDFNQFEALIRTINMFQVYLDELEGIFRHLDYQNTGKVLKEDLFTAISKLETVNELKTSDEGQLKLPTAREFEMVSEGIDQKELDYFTYEEFLHILMNVSNLEDSDDD
eukprot:CAMPEP_0205813684 /NCGR_PEP_ID=MMETSP0205-20121125/18406_1 /ASSEMBLY_ACC=CAM_ASM_000278 /TAXON_ID=36767 /ORGANISM="Euplotes focardii, Strain TN1" /LENGTH=123 /DNA_ID=CAMNT_0053096145 /DNA_START=284 /DNA_END=652 /DNA_ORIENTATION=+